MEAEKTMGSKIVSVLLLFGVSLLSSACRTADPQEEADDPFEFHAVESERLREVMLELLDQTFRRVHVPLQTEEELEASRAEIVELAESLSEASREIPAEAGRLELSAEDRSDFTELAELLTRRATGLAEQAREGGTLAIKQSYDELTTTCIQCHVRFRLVVTGDRAN